MVMGAVPAGAGMILGAGLMQRASYWEMEKRVVNHKALISGDSMFTSLIMSQTRVLMTDPGELIGMPVHCW